MQLQRIQERLAGFKNHLQSPTAQYWLHLWESQQIFQTRWDADAPDIRATYDAALDSPVTRRLWSRENYAPKQMMLIFAELAPDMVRVAFQDLFNENKDIEVRLDRFVYYCDELLSAYKGQTNRPAWNRHFHDDDYAIISLYLAFRYPDRYAPYRHAAFVEMLRQLAAANLPRSNDPARWFKVARTLYGFMQKDTELLSLHQQRLLPDRHYTGSSLLLAYEFCLWCARQLVEA